MKGQPGYYTLLCNFLFRKIPFSDLEIPGKVYVKLASEVTVALMSLGHPRHFAPVPPVAQQLRRTTRNVRIVLLVDDGTRALADAYADSQTDVEVPRSPPAVM